MNRFIEIITRILENPWAVAVIGPVLTAGILGLIKSVIDRRKEKQLPEYFDEVNNMIPMGTPVNLRMQVITSANIGRPEYGRILERKYFLNRFCYDKNGKKRKIKEIKAGIEDDKYNDNHVIIMGASGLGKSTLLRWLFLRVNSRKYDNLAYFPSGLFKDCPNMEAVIQNIGAVVNGKGRCLLFLDGVDELKCITGEEKDLADLFNRLIGLPITGTPSPKAQNSKGHTVIITTRPEHFEFIRTVNTQSGKIGYDRFSLYRLYPMGGKEAKKMCLCTVRRYMDMNNSAIAGSYKDKSPLSKSEFRIYQRQLHWYLERCRKDGQFSSVLDNPMLCRYSYQIVSNSVTENDTPVFLTEIQKREIALRSIIGWEYHDGETTESKTVSKNDAKGMEHFERVSGFLSEIAVKASDNGDRIKRDDWESLKNQYRLDINSSLSLLEEGKNGELSFADLSFYEYFLARWLAQADRNTISGETRKKLCRLLKQNKEFAEMYSEFVVKDALSDSFLASMPIGDLANFTQGKQSRLFEESNGFTIDDILQYFPLSTVMYYGMDFDFHSMQNINETGILNIDSGVQYLAEKSIKWLTRQEITGVSVPRGCFLPHDVNNSMQMLALFFLMYQQGDLLFINDAIWTEPDKEKRMLKERMKTDKLSEIPGVSSAEMQLHIIQIENDKKYEWERKLTLKAMLLISRFIDKTGTYWCLLNGDSMVICKPTKKNAELLKDIFVQNSVIHPAVYAYAYSHYLLHIKPLSNFIETIKPYKIDEDINYIFYPDFFYDSNFLKEKERSFMVLYYDIRDKNRDILGVFQHEEFERTTLRLERSLYDITDELLKQLNSPKLECIISDEKLIFYYAMNESGLLMEEAKKTISYCEEINYGDGVAIRDSILKSEDLIKDMDRIGQMITEKLANQIWF